MFRHACASASKAGIVSKRADSRYRSGRCAAWLKVKNPITSAEGATLCISICVGTSILPGMPRDDESKPRVRSLRKLRKQPVLSRLTPPRESWRKRFSSSAQSKRVGKRGSGNTGVGYRQRVSRSSQTRRTGGRSCPIRQESNKSPPKKSTEDARKGDALPTRRQSPICAR